MNKNIISNRLYDRESKEYGKYKVLKFDHEKNEKEYYLIKFKDSGNEKVVPIHQILKGEVIDTEFKKTQTKRKNREKKRESKVRKEWQTKYLHNPNNILILDLASESSGFCVIKGKKIKEYGYIYHENTKIDGVSNLVERLCHMKIEIVKLIKNNDIDAVVIESLPFKGAKQVLFVLAQVRILVLEYCYSNDIQYISVSPQGWENYIWKGRFKSLETKEKTLESLKTDYKLDFKKLYPGNNHNETKKKVWEDVADAVGLAIYVLSKRIMVEN